MKVNQINGLNRQARKFLLEHCISRKNAEVMAYGFDGFINGDYHKNQTLIRILGNWEVFRSKEIVQSINGEVDFFALTRHSI